MGMNSWLQITSTIDYIIVKWDCLLFFYVLLLKHWSQPRLGDQVKKWDCLLTFPLFFYFGITLLPLKKKSQTSSEFSWSCSKGIVSSVNGTYHWRCECWFLLFDHQFLGRRLWFSPFVHVWYTFFLPFLVNAVMSSLIFIYCFFVVYFQRKESK